MLWLIYSSTSRQLEECNIFLVGRIVASKVQCCLLAELYSLIHLLIISLLLSHLSVVTDNPLKQQLHAQWFGIHDTVRHG